MEAHKVHNLSVACYKLTFLIFFLLATVLTLPDMSCFAYQSFALCLPYFILLNKSFSTCILPFPTGLLLHIQFRSGYY